MCELRDSVKSVRTQLLNLEVTSPPFSLFSGPLQVPSPKHNIAIESLALSRCATGTLWFGNRRQMDKGINSASWQSGSSVERSSSQSSSVIEHRRIHNSDSSAGPQPDAEDSAQEGSPRAVQPAEGQEIRTMLVPTFAPPRQIRAAAENITELRRIDPFLYHSDPARRRAYLLHHNDEGNINQDNPQQQQQAVERRTRISFEVHPSLLLESLMDGAEEGGGGEDEGGEA